MGKKVLFVCVGNSCRSQMAEALARLAAGDGITVMSAGSRPARHVNAVAIEVMREIGYDLGRHEPKPVTRFADTAFDCIVTMGCGDSCPVLTTGWREDWNIPDCAGMGAAEMRQIRDQLELKVRLLIKRLHSLG